MFVRGVVLFPGHGNECVYCLPLVWTHSPMAHSYLVQWSPSPQLIGTAERKETLVYHMCPQLLTDLLLCQYQLPPPPPNHTHTQL